MELDNALRELRDIAEKLHRVSSIELSPEPEVLRERISIYQLEITRCLNRNKDLFGIPPDSWESRNEFLCSKLDEEPREIIPTETHFDDYLNEHEVEVVDEVKRLAHFQFFAEWLGSLVERFAVRCESDHKYLSDPLQWHLDHKAGKLTIDPSSPIREIKTGLTGASLIVVDADKRQETDSRKEAPRKPGKAGLRNLQLYLAWSEANDRTKQTKRGFAAEYPREIKVDWIDDGLKIFKDGWRLRNGRPYHIDSDD